jgi:glutamyl-tRNA(Gln) amidotransferase subunit D
VAVPQGLNFKENLMARQNKNQKQLEKLKLGLVQTGGTIASVKGPLGTAPSLGNAIAGLLDIDIKNCQIVTRQPYKILSENANTEVWQKVAVAVAELVNEGMSGIIITHGTDTMAYTAAALSYMLRPLPVPIILTGSMLSSDDPETDGRDNLMWSIKAALHPDTPREVSVMFGGGLTDISAYYAGVDNFNNIYHTERLEQILIRGCRVKKVSAWSNYFKPDEKRYAAFQSIHDDILGAVPAGGKLVINPNIQSSPVSASSIKRSPLTACTDLEPRVIPLRIYPGFNPDLLVALVEDFKYRGIILEGYGDGTMPSGDRYSLLPSIAEVTRKGVCVCITSSVLGPATTGVYASSRELTNAGALPLHDMTTESAIVKLMWALGNSNSIDQTKAIMHQNLAGEITVPKSHVSSDHLQLVLA